MGKKKKGLKFDLEKLPIGEVFKQFPRAIEAIAACALYGHTKYELGNDWANWSRLENAESRYNNAGGRHLIKRCKGIIRDHESGLPHIYHDLWNKAAEVELDCRKREKKANKKRKKSERKN